MSDSLLTALRERPAFSALTAADLKPLPATGTAHGHVRLPNGLLARVAYAHEGDAAAAARLATQAEAFRHLAPAGRTPRLHDVIEPRPGLPGGALIVDRIDGRAPRLPDELGAMADTLARIHALPLPPAGSPIPRQKNPFLETLAAIEQNAMRFLDKAVPDSGARAEIAEELRLMRGMALAFAQARAAAHRGAGRHASGQLHRRSRRHRLVRRPREGPCRLARDRPRACNACNLDAVASRCRQSAVTRRRSAFLRAIS